MIKVVIVRASNDIIWEGLEKLLSSVSDFDVSSIDDESTLSDILGSYHPQILILEESFGTQKDLDYKQYPEVGIIVISPTSGEISLRLQNIDSEMLISQVRILATKVHESENNNSSPLRIKYIHPEDILKLVANPLKIRVISNTGYANSRQHLSAICKWIDLSLHLYFARNITNNNEINTPGWAMSADRARALLGDTFAHTTADELSRLLNLFEKKMAGKEEANSLGSGISKFVTFFNSFNLNKIERQILLYVIAPEIDGRYARVFGYLNDDLTRRRPTPSILNQLVYDGTRLAWDIRQLMAGEGSIAKFQLLLSEQNDTLPESEVGLKAPPDILTYLLAEHDYSPNFNPALELHQTYSSSKSITKNEYSDLQEKLEHWLRKKNGETDLPIIQLLGDDTTLEWFKQTAINAGEAVVIMNLSVINERGDSRPSDLIYGAIRMAILHNAILVVSGLTALQGNERQQFEKALATNIIARVNRMVVHSKAPWVIHGVNEIWQITREVPSFKARISLWKEHAQLAGINLSKSDASSLAATIRFDEPEINATISLCRGESIEASPLVSIQTAARKVARTKIPSLVRRLETSFDWEDIVLPTSTLALLKQIPGHVRHAREVFEDWGYYSRLPYGSGVAALFSGPSGTGKTMAAQVIANELNVELFQIDLANTVSKYIGETEKNLDIIFNAAEHASAVLLFDEADALFGKRTDIKDAHDRYANVEVAYLLQRMEAYSGLAILTSNFKQNLDSAFLRRLRFVIDFPAPSAAHREAIWHCVFPSEVKFAADVDTTFLARRLELTGGNIQQIAVRAAFAAVADGSDAIAMNHIVQATREELTKLGMLSAERSLSDWLPVLVSGESS